MHFQMRQTVFSTSTGKTFLLSVLFWTKIFILVLSEIICLFCFWVLFSNIYPKIRFMTKNCPDLCNFYSKVLVWNFCLRKYFVLFFAEFELLMPLNKRNMLKICLQISYLTDSCIILHSFLLWGKVKIFINKKQQQKKKKTNKKTKTKTNND